MLQGGTRCRGGGEAVRRLPNRLVHQRTDPSVPGSSAGRFYRVGGEIDGPSGTSRVDRGISLNLWGVILEDGTSCGSPLGRSDRPLRWHRDPVLPIQDVVNNLQLGAGGVEDRKQFALKIAKDLFQVIYPVSLRVTDSADVLCALGV